MRSLEYILNIVRSWGGLRPAFEKGPEGPVFRPVKWVLIPLILLAGCTYLSWLGNFDFEAQKAIFTAGQESWDFGKRSLWDFLYHYGTYPAGIVCLAAFIGLVCSLFVEKVRKWRHCFLFIVLVGAIGPGVVTNLILKEHWGRPRPREVQGLGGYSNFEKVLHIDKSSNGKSFPCGHATMGYFFVGGFFLLRRYRRDWAWFFLVLGLVLGFFMGIARMCQGGHYFSDVMWSGAIIYFVSMLLYYDLGLHKGICREPKKLPGWLKILIPVAGAALVVGILLATPYQDTKKYELLDPATKTGPMHLSLVLKAGNVQVVGGKEFKITSEAWGHGVPTSKIATTFKAYQTSEGIDQVLYHERMSGRFTEVNQDLKIVVPWARVKTLTLDLENCQTELSIDGMHGTAAKVNILTTETDEFLYESKSGSLIINSFPKMFAWKTRQDRESFGLPNHRVTKGNPVIDVDDSFQGKIEW